MGKGDLRTRRGKLWRGTHGNARPKASKKRKRREGREAKEQPPPKGTTPS
jgi:30S ribosomal protein S31